MANIPVLPLPYGSAKEIFERMTGKPVPTGWQGGLPYTYRLEGGPELKVRVNVSQKREVQRVYDVVGTLVGSELPNEWVMPDHITTPGVLARLILIAALPCCSP